MPSPFEELLNDLAAVQERRTTQPPSRDTAPRAARQAQRDTASRATAPRRLMKSEPVPVPNYTPDWDGLAARQERIAADLERSRIAAQQQAIRAHLATLAAAAKAGRLTAHQACLLDVYRGQALSLGLEP